MISAFPQFDEANVVSLLEEIRVGMNGNKDELVFDFSAVRKLDTSSLRALEQFASHADDKQIKVVLRGVTVEVYKVLTLVKLTSRFSFIS